MPTGVAASHKLYRPALLLLAGLLLAGVAPIQQALNRQRSDPAMGIRRITSLGKTAPPALEFVTVAMGGFRGLIANALWLRATDLQDQGKYFEMVQLADWITKLEPTFAQVWLVQAWNMAYNISVKFSDPADRWRWVQRGIELLRDEGLRYNPREALLYRELGWFFQHKMGHNLDDAHLFYKSAWAKEMTDLFGGPRPDFDELLNPTTGEARQRSLTLREKYKLDPQIMKEVEETYGPLEWRLPETHAIYWGHVGLSRSRKKDLITLRRVIYQSIQTAVLRGRIVMTYPDGTLVYAPNLALADRANTAYEQMIEEDEEMRHAIKIAHRNFLRELVYILYTYNRPNEAARYFKLAREKYPDAIPEPLTLEEYAVQRLTENLPVLANDRVRAVLEGVIVQYFVNWAIDEDDRAEGLERLARQFWEFYDSRAAARRAALQMPPYLEMKQNVLKYLLDPQSELNPDIIARLRSKLARHGIPIPQAEPEK
jgi:hypothetical protein